MKYLIQFGNELWFLVLDMAPWLLLGFLIAGVLHVFFSQGRINKLLGKSNMRSVIRAALIGIPLPLCSCGVIPTGVSIYKNGASKGASISFLISTPQTGIDSIMVTYSMMGLPFAIVRPIVALLTGVFGGAITNRLEDKSIADEDSDVYSSEASANRKGGNVLVDVFRYAFIDFLGDIAKWLVVGLLIAAAIAVFVPDDFFAAYIRNDFLGMLIILVASIPVYVCATSSIPIAAVLILKGLSPGAALVFLMAGPATNAATISVIGKSMGRKTLISYLLTLIIGALASGLFIDYLLPREWFTFSISQIHGIHEHTILPYWLNLVSGILIIAFMLNIFIRRWVKKFLVKNDQRTNDVNMNEIMVSVKGMNCNHCKMNVESNLRKIDGIEDINANIEEEVVTIKGDRVDFKEIKDTVESIGYSYGGKIE